MHARSHSFAILLQAPLNRHRAPQTFRAQNGHRGRPTQRRSTEGSRKLPGTLEQVDAHTRPSWSRPICLFWFADLQRRGRTLENARCRAISYPRSFLARSRSGLAVLQLPATYVTQSQTESRTLCSRRTREKEGRLHDSKPKRRRYEFSSSTPPLARLAQHS